MKPAGSRFARVAQNGHTSHLSKRLTLGGSGSSDLAARPTTASPADLQCRTTLRYRCHVACPSTGKTTTNPTRNGTDPRTRPPATISPQIAMMSGFAATARTDVATAVPIPALRSSNNGNDTTLIASTRTANRNPTPTPTTNIVHPALVANTSWTNVSVDTGGMGPSVR